MLLKNNLYSIASVATEGHASFGLKLNAECFIYKAHFPGEPITPGVCIVQIAKELLEELLERKLEITLVKNVKFLSVLSPAQSPDVCFDFTKVTVDGHTVKAQVTVTAAGELKAKASIVCESHGEK